jgi:hypothetical protein
MKNTIILLVIGLSLSMGAIDLEINPYWTSPTIPYPASVWGVYLVDITNDGFPEVMMVGEQMQCYLFPNDSGVIGNTPSWLSNDADRSIWASFGDYDNDGDLDMAVANYYMAGGRTKVYRNDDGTLTNDPVWTAASGAGDWCEWGDVDNDGDLDLAICDLFANPGVFRNNDGVLESTPFWIGSDYNIDFGGAWIDVDLDGDLDLAIAAINWQIPVLRIYYNDAGNLETTASWSSQVDPNNYVGAIPVVGDINRDGWPDIAAPMGLFDDNDANAVYANVSGTLEQMPSWFSDDTRPSTSGVLGDINGDGYIDWAVNNDLDHCVAYENVSGILNTTPAWQSNTSGGLGIDLGDVDQDGAVYKEDTIIADGTKKLFYLSTLPMHKLEEITINGDTVSVRNYCYNAKSYWVSFKDSIPAGSQIIFKYYHSKDMELLQSDYNNSQAHLFRNNTGIVEQICSPVDMKLKVYPNPIVAGKAIELFYTLPHPSFVTAKLYDCTGRKIATVFRQKAGAGVHKAKLPAQFSSGIYFLQLKYNNISVVKKVVITK